MTTTRPLAVDLFAQAGIAAHDQGVLPDALLELSIRLEIAGAGDLLTFITNHTCWTPHDDEPCPSCGHMSDKRDPQPHPKPPPPPPPKPGK